MRTFGPWWQQAPEAPPPVSPFSSRFGATDFVELKFDHPVYPESVTVYETYVGRKSPLATKNLLEVTDGLRRPP